MYTQSLQVMNDIIQKRKHCEKLLFYTYHTAKSQNIESMSDFYEATEHLELLHIFPIKDPVATSILKHVIQKLDAVFFNMQPSVIKFKLPDNLEELVVGVTLFRDSFNHILECSYSFFLLEAMTKLTIATDSVLWLDCTKPKK